jgi:hypothetical protein
MNHLQLNINWCKFPRDGERWHAIVGTGDRTLCGIETVFASQREKQPGWRQCRECRVRLIQKERSK